MGEHTDQAVRCSAASKMLLRRLLTDMLDDEETVKRRKSAGLPPLSMKALADEAIAEYVARKRTGQQTENPNHLGWGFVYQAGEAALVKRNQERSDTRAP